MKYHRPVCLSLSMFALILAAGCGSDSGNGGTDPNQSSSLSGTWSGTIGQSGEAHPTTLVWTATQSGANLTGPIAATISDGTQTHVVNGTMSGGLISASGITLTFSFPAGAFTSVGAPATCGMSGTGNASLAAKNIAGPMTITWGATCVGSIADKASETDQITLSRP